jgi:hypothetical protein
LVPVLDGGAMQSFGPSALGLGVTTGEACEALGDGCEELADSDDPFAEDVDVGPQAAKAHTPRRTNEPNADARAGCRITHPTLATHARFEAVFNSPFPPAFMPLTVCY